MLATCRGRISMYGRWAVLRAGCGAVGSWSSMQCMRACGLQGVADGSRLVWHRGYTWELLVSGAFTSIFTSRLGWAGCCLGNVFVLIFKLPSRRYFTAAMEA